RSDNVIKPEICMSFDSLGEAYDFYNLYSWEVEFGNRYGKSRLNVERTKCLQEIVCGCSGKPEQQNSRSCRCECPAMTQEARERSPPTQSVESFGKVNPEAPGWTKRLRVGRAPPDRHRALAKLLHSKKQSGGTLISHQTMWSSQKLE
uniref:FAR1 domain-containing protein n=3 Tax=Aegilops tauschii subsp. strangulata TaxID=200361 RepID=A0A453IEG9_AEGTS